MVLRKDLIGEEPFRQQLRRAVARTLPIAAVSGALFFSNCVDNVSKPPISPKSEYPTSSTEYSTAERNDGGSIANIPDNAPTMSKVECPTAPPKCLSPDRGEGGSEDVYARYRYLLDKGIPFSKEECLKLCEQQVTQQCDPVLQGGEYSRSTGCFESTDSEGRAEARCTLVVSKNSCPVAGRRPEGLKAQQTSSLSLPMTPQAEAGAFFAELAYLEEAAVTAFRYLAQELKAYDAPAAFIQVAEEAIHEEIEHAELMTALAHRYGATVAPVEVEPFALRPLCEIAYDNAREGCTRETFGSLMAMWQAETAEDPAVRAVVERIAWEEARHAALSWKIDAWIRPQLTPEERTTCERIHQESVAMLHEEVSQPVSPALIRYAGYPPPEVAQALLHESFAA